MALDPLLMVDDGNNKFTVYEVYTPNRRYSLEDVQPTLTFEDVNWGTVALRGLEVRTITDDNDTRPLPPTEDGVYEIQGGTTISLQLYWQRTGETVPPLNHSVLIHLVDPETGEIISQRDGVIAEDALPLHLLPHPDLVPDRRLWTLPDEPGRYDLRIGIYDPQNLAIPPLTAYWNGMEQSNSFTLEGIIKIK
jgi:hypothetical protein